VQGTLQRQIAPFKGDVEGWGGGGGGGGVSPQSGGGGEGGRKWFEG